MEAARAEADRIGKPVSVAIVDAACTLVLFERLNDAHAYTAFVAEGKACASALVGRSGGTGGRTGSPGRVRRGGHCEVHRREQQERLRTPDE